MKKVCDYVKKNKWIILVVLTALAAVSLVFVDKDGVDNNSAYEVVE